ncbi:MAG: hypothetical protein H6607_00380 [Flavobacteriales bacterium]|nr:hypothetical protein [Flavobacteriales bacterium]
MSEEQNLKKIDTGSSVDILINEYNLCDARISTWQNRQDIVMQISLLLIGASMSFCVINDVAPEFYLIIPIIPIIIISQIAYHHIKTIVNQGYREYLQDKINAYLPEKNVKYTTLVKKYLLDSNPVSKFNKILFPATVVISIIFSLVMSEFNMYVVIGNIVLSVFTVLYGISIRRFLKNLNERVKIFCNEN